MPVPRPPWWTPRALAVTLVASLVAGCAAAPASGTPTLSVAPGIAARNAAVTVVGHGFPAGSEGDILFAGSVREMPDFIAAADGTFRAVLDVPELAPPGPNAVQALSADGRTSARATLSVLAGRTAAAGPSAGPTQAGAPDFAHVYLIVMENKSYDEIVGNARAPYLNRLAAEGGLATDYEAVGGGSANYFALLGGDTEGFASDGTRDVHDRNLLDQLEAHGRSWAVFGENAPGGCFKGVRASGGEDGAGTYVRAHEPAISYTDVSGSPARCANITDLTHFDPAAAGFELVIPDTCHDMHDCSVAAGDAWLRSFVPRITASPAFADSLLVITFDEGDGESDAPVTTDAGRHVATILVSPRITPGTRSAVLHDHFSLLRTIEDAWNLGCLGHSCAANDLHEFFGARGAG